MVKCSTARRYARSEPLADVYKYYRNSDYDYMETIWKSIQGRANDVLAKQRALPVYNHSGAYACEHGTLGAYRASRKANVACRDASDDAISRHYQYGAAAASSARP